MQLNNDQAIIIFVFYENCYCYGVAIDYKRPCIIFYKSSKRTFN